MMTVLRPTEPGRFFVPTVSDKRIPAVRLYQERPAQVDGDAPPWVSATDGKLVQGVFDSRRSA